MRWWPLFGISRRLTEKRDYESAAEVRPLPRLFRRSFFIYAVDAGNSNALNIEVAALRAPQYNIHRLGIFFTDTPRHADLLLVLGQPTSGTIGALTETLSQIPQPFGILHIREPLAAGNRFVDFDPPQLVARIEGRPEAPELLGILLKIRKGGAR